jgi:hypothetical protein
MLISVLISLPACPGGEVSMAASLSRRNPNPKPGDNPNPRSDVSTLNHIPSKVPKVDMTSVG